MKLHPLLPALMLVVLAMACTDSPTGPIVDHFDAEFLASKDAAEGAFNKGATGIRSEWQLFFEDTLDEGDFAQPFFQCPNDGDGEESWWAGTYAGYYKEVVTPSANINQNFWYAIGDDSRVIGMTTGEVWTMYRYQSQFHMHQKKADGLLYLHQPDQMWFENADGDRIKMLFVWDQVMPPDWTIGEDRTHVAHCNRLGK